MRIEFKIKNDMLVLDKQKDTFSGNVNFYQCSFDIQTNQELVWICVFKKGDKVYQQVIENGVCIIPQEVLLEKGKIQIGCYAVTGNDEVKRISTNWIPITISEGAYSQGSAPKVPEKDVWETLMLKNVPYIGENGNWYIFDSEKLDYVDTGRSSVGEKGEKGDRGETGLPGTTNAANALRGTAIGHNIALTDVSSIEHSMEVKIRSKNIARNIVFRNGKPNQIVFTANFNIEKGKRYIISFDTLNTGNRVHVSISLSYRIPIESQTVTKECNGNRQTFMFEAKDDFLLSGVGIIQAHASNEVDITEDELYNIMIEEGEVATDYTPYIADVSGVLVEVSDDNGRFEEVYSSTEGKLEDIVSSYPLMNFTVMNPNVVVDVTYNKDINKAFSELQEKFTNAIISLGGNV